MKKILLLLCTLSSLSLLAQDTTWKLVRIDENLSISLPGKIQKIDSTLIEQETKEEMLIYKASIINHTSIGVAVTPGKVNAGIGNSRTLKEYYEGVANGFRESASKRGMHAYISDTTIEHIPCLKAISYLDTTETSATLLVYMFLLDDKMYSINTYSPRGPKEQSRQVINKLISSIRITVKNREKQKSAFGAGAADNIIPGLIGKLLVSLLAISGIIFLIIFLSRKTVN